MFLYEQGGKQREKYLELLDYDLIEFCKFRKLPNRCIKLDLGGFTEPSSYPVCFFQFHFTVAACCEHLSLLIAIVCLPLLCECVFFFFHYNSYIVHPLHFRRHRFYYKSATKHDIQIHRRVLPSPISSLIITSMLYLRCLCCCRRC